MSGARVTTRPASLALTVRGSLKPPTTTSEPSTALQDSANYAVPWHIVGQFKESVILKVRLCNPAKAATDKFQHVLQLAV